MHVVVVESPAKAKTVGRYGMRVPGRRRIWSSATSPPTHPIGCGSQTSPRSLRRRTLLGTFRHHR